MAQLLLNGAVTGLLLALPSLALALTFSVLRFANYAIGSTLMAGAYAAYLFNVREAWPLPLAAAAGSVLIGGLTLVLDRIVYRPLRGRSSVTLLVASMGIALAMENMVRLFAGNSPRGYAVEIARPLRWEGLRVNHEQLTVLVTVLTALALIWIVFRHTSLGRSMRAVADNPDLAAARGISRNKVVAAVWLIASAMTTVAGVLIGLDTNLDPQMGANYVLPVFTATILGGIASPMAAVAGALTLGIAEELATLVLPPHYRAIIAFGAMALLLLVRPSGLFGTKWVDK